MKNILYLSVFIVIFSCNTGGVSQNKKKKNDFPQLSKAEKEIEPKSTIVSKKQFDNGIKIQWFEKGKGPKVQDDHVYMINYKLKLKSGKVLEGNHQLSKKELPYLVGFNTYLPGFEFAFKELNVGDFVELYIPAKLARGDREIKGVLPANSDNIFHLKVIKELKPTKNIDGIKLWTLEKSKRNIKAFITSKSNVSINFFVGSKSNPRYANSYANGAPFAFNMQDASLIPGLKKILIGRNLYEKLWIIVPPKYAFGSKGSVGTVKPNEAVFYDLFVVDVDKKVMKYLPKKENKKSTT